MTDHAKIVQDFLDKITGGWTVGGSLAALVAERDEALMLAAGWRPHRLDPTHLVTRAEAAEAERDEALAKAARLSSRGIEDLRFSLEAAEAEVARLTDEMERVAAQQPKTLAMIEANGFVFDSIGREPGNWQHLAFSVYTDLCEVDTIARAALGKDNE